MWYAAHELAGLWRDSMAQLARAGLAAADALDSPILRANWALALRLTRDYPRQPFDVPGVREVVVAERPFCRLLHFSQGNAARPRVLLCAPLSGHHPTLLRDTIVTLLRDCDVYLTDWRDARDVPLAQGDFPLAAYVGYIRAFIAQLGARDLHVLAVCQPTVPVLAAVALDAADGKPTPRTLTLMGGPIDARESPTSVNRFATTRSLDWFRTHAVQRVPARYPGAGRAVYPGYAQLAAFVAMNPLRHAQAHQTYWLDMLRGNEDAARAHERFYDEYNAVLDMDAAYYLDTVRDVFQDFALARGTWNIDGQLVAPRAITETPLLAIEGEHDDISGRGQTTAALSLCSGLAATAKHAFLAAGAGHYGIFSGQRWRDVVYPRVLAHIEGTPP
ncbi:MAG TPA: polyhydroxyalkanoate depolymerase [Kofleriaceae bacterium]|jgi:poly(3-hydroxybutyrate) depolymerase